MYARHHASRLLTIRLWPEAEADSGVDWSEKVTHVRHQKDAPLQKLADKSLDVMQSRRETQRMHRLCDLA